ncbi:hypothetical protein CIW52_31820 [Mycolicibacterium sp. P9-64]|nr:hypothetical protein CIW52_31820 [Mycolicibacterium sp. P9-64]
MAGWPGAAHQVWDANARALITIGHGGFGDLVDGRLTDASRLQVTGSLDEATPSWAFAQSVARARDAADRLLASTRHALDASDPVPNRWRDVHAGCRPAARIIDGLGTRQQSLGLR